MAAFHNRSLPERPTMNRGGHRPHAGRKLGSGRYGEPTKAMRIPKSRAEEILNLLQKPSKREEAGVSESLIPPVNDIYSRPVYTTGMAAPSPSSKIEASEKFNLNTYLIPHPERMAFIKIADAAMCGAGIVEGDLLLVDRGLPLTRSRIVCAFINDELVVRRLIEDKGALLLMADNPLYPPQSVTGDVEFILLGVGTTVVHALQ